MDRLLLPRVRLEPEGVEHPIPEAGSPLPRWQTLPMDAKFPVDPAPRGEVTFVTTKMCQPAYRSSQREDFDLTDPYNRTIKSEYKSLYDPFLKGWFSKPHVRQRLVEQNLITEKGNISCSVRDFNDYRYFLRQQAVIKSKHEDPAPLERRQHLIQQKKLKAEVFGVEVKYKLLKVKQTTKEEEEEKRKKYEEKQQQEAERMRQFEERRQVQLTRSRNKVNDKFDEIRRRESIMRKKAEEKLIQFESEAQRRLNIIDYLREQKFYEQDQKRKEAWRKKREYQMKVMDNTERMKRKVEAQMRLEKRRYEEDMVKRMVKDQIGLVNKREERERTKSDVNEAFAKRMAYALEGTKQKTVWDTRARAPATRRASLWMLEEVLNRLGLYNKYKELKSDEWKNLLDSLISSTVRKMETASVIGEEQELLSSIVHMLLRRLKEAYPAPTGQDNLPDVDAEEEKELADKSRLFPDLDTSFETEMAIRISMMTTLDLAPKPDQHVALGGNWMVPSDNDEAIDQHENFFAQKMRIGETDAFAVEKELTQFLDYLKDENMSVKDMKAVVMTILKLANHESITLPDPCGQTERNPDARTVYAFEGWSNDSLQVDSSNSKHTPLTVSAQQIGGVSESRKASTSSDKRTPVVSTDASRTLQAPGTTGDDPQISITYATAPPGVSELQELTDAPGATEVPEMTEFPEKGVEEVEEGEAPGAEEARESTDVPEVTSLAGEPELKGSPKTSEVTEAEEYGVAEDDKSSEGNPENLQEDVSDIQGPTEDDALDLVTDEKTLDKKEEDEEGSLDDNQNKETGDSKTEDVTEERSESPEERSEYEKDETNEESNDDSDGGGKEEDVSGRPALDNGDSADADAAAADNEDVAAAENEDDTLAADNDDVLAENEDAGSVEGGGEPVPEDDRGSGPQVLKTPVPEDERSPGAQDLTTPRAAEIEAESGDDVRSRFRTPNEEKIGSETQITKRPSQAEGSKNPIIARMESSDKPSRRSSSWYEESEYLFGSEQNPELIETPLESESDLTKMARVEMEEERLFTELVEMEDIPAVTQHFLHKIQERGRLQGVCFPPSRYHRFIAMTLSKIWAVGASVQHHTFGQWLTEPEVGEVAKSFLHSIRKKRLPPALIRNIATAMTSALMHDITDSSSYWSDGLVRAILEKFHNSLQNETVAIGVIERVLKQVLEEYMEYEEMNPDFKIENFLTEIMEMAYDFCLKGIVKRMNFLEAIEGYDDLPKDRQDLLYCSNWTKLLHRSLVTIQLRMLTPEVRKKLRDVVINCGALLLAEDKDDNVNECISRIKTRIVDPVFKYQVAVTYSANTVVELVQLAEECHVSSSMLLPGALNVSQSAMRGPAVSKFGPDTLGECVVVLMMDQLAQRAGTDALKPPMAGHLAAYLVELLVSDFGYKRSSLDGGGLKEAFDTTSARLRYKDLGFSACKKILGCLFRTFLAISVKHSSNMQDMVQPLSTIKLDPEQMTSFLNLIAQVYFTFVAAMVLKVASSGLKVEEPHEIQILYVWRTIAQLAKEGKSVIKDFLTTKPVPANYLVLKSDSTTIQRFAYTVMGQQEANPKIEDQGEVDESSQEDPKLLQLSQTFLKSVLGAVHKAGYVPVKDNYHSSRKSRAHSIYAPPHMPTEEEELVDEYDELRSRPTPETVEAVIRRELIFSLKDIGDAMATPESLKMVAPKLADYLASTVFILDRFVILLYEKLWDARNALVKNKITPRDLQSYIIGETSDCLTPLELTHEDALRLVTRAIFETEATKTSVTTLAKMAESLSRVGLDNGGVRGQPHAVLSCVPPRLVTQLVRACMLTTLRTLTSVLKGSLDKTIWSPLRMSVYNDEQRHLISAYVIVHNVLSTIRNSVEEEKNHRGLWTPKCVADTGEDSVLALPIEVIDKVFARIGGVLDALTESPDTGCDDGFGQENKGTSSPTVLAENVINCVMNSVVYRVEIGEFPFVRINDLLRTEAATKSKVDKPPQTGNNIASYNVSDNKKANASSNSFINPLAKIQEDVSQAILSHICIVFTSIHQQLKDDIDAALVMNANYDSELEARVFIDVILGKVRSHAKRKDIRFVSGFPQGAEKEGRFDDPFALVERLGHCQADRSSLCTASVTKFESASTITSYISGLLERITEEKKMEGEELEKTANQIRTIIKACLAADFKFVSPKGQSEDGQQIVQISRSDAVCVLVVEVILNELFNRLRWCKKCADESVFKKTAHPYLYSRTFKDPDPLGPYYAEVMDREKRLSNFINVETTTCLSKTTHGRQGSSIMIDSSCKVESSVRTKPSSSCQSDRHKSERCRGTEADVMTSKKIISRVSEWRRNIQATSAANSLDTAKSSSSLWKPKASKRLSQMNVSQNKLTKVEIKSISRVKPTGVTAKPVRGASKERSNISSGQTSKPAHVTKRCAAGTSVKDGKAAIKQKPNEAPGANKVCKPTKPMKKSTRGKVKDWMVSPGLHQERVVEVIYHMPVTKAKGEGENIPEEPEAEKVAVVKPDGRNSDTEAEDYSSDEDNEGADSHRMEEETGVSLINKEETERIVNVCESRGSEGSTTGQMESKLLLGLVMSLLAEEMSDLTSLVYKCFTRAELGELSVRDLACLLSCLDLAKGKLELGSLDDVEKLLSGKVQMSMASERLIGSVTSVFKCIEGGMITKEELGVKIQELVGQDYSMTTMDTDRLKTQLSAATQELLRALSDLDCCPPEAVTKKYLEIMDVMQQHQQPIDDNQTGEGGASNQPMAEQYDEEYEDDEEDHSEDECDDKDDASDDGDSNDEEDGEEGADAGNAEAGVAGDDQSQESTVPVPHSHQDEDRAEAGCSQSSSWSSLASSVTSRSRSTRPSSSRDSERKSTRSGSREDLQVSHRSDGSSKSSRRSDDQPHERSGTSTRSSRPSSADTRSSLSSRSSNRADTPQQRASVVEAAQPSGVSTERPGGSGGSGSGAGGSSAQPPVTTTNRCRNTLGLDRVDHELAKICELPLPCLDPELRLIDASRDLDPDDVAWIDDTPEPGYQEEDEYEMDEADGEGEYAMDEAGVEEYYTELSGDYGETDGALSTNRSGRGEDTGRGEGDGCDGDCGRGEEEEEGLGEYDGQGSESDKSLDSESENEGSDGTYTPEE